MLCLTANCQMNEMLKKYGSIISLQHWRRIMSFNIWRNLFTCLTTLFETFSDEYFYQNHK